MKIIYFGTPDFAVAPLESLAKNPNFEILAVVTQPDKPTGKKQILTPSAVKIAAFKRGLPVLQPKSKKELEKMLEKFSADFFIVIAYGMILTKKVLDIPKIACINVHGSLLPKYRGASPIQETLLNGDAHGGLTLIKMVEKMDQGPVYLIRRIPIEKTDSYFSLSEKLSTLTAELLPLALEDIKGKILTPIDQNEDAASYCHKISREDGNINWQLTTQEILNRLRAYTPWPGVFTKIDSKKLSILEAAATPEKIPAGKFKVDQSTIKVGTKDGSLELVKIQLEGKNPMNAKDFLNGYRKLLENL